MAAIGARFGKRVRRLRKARRWSIDDLAEAAGLSGNTIQRVETAKHDVTVAQAEKIARALDMPVQELLAEDRPKSERQQVHDALDEVRDEDLAAVRAVVELARRGR